MKLNNSLKTRFCNDMKLPINLVQEPYFDYFINLYNPHFDTVYKLDVFNKFLNKFNEPEEFFKYSSDLMDNLKNTIKNTQAYEQMNNCDMSKNFPQLIEVKQQNIYIEPNVGKKLISIDLEKANFNVFKLFDLDKELKINSYQELLNKFTQEEYYELSKKIRQVVFGDLNPSRQQKIQKHIISYFCKILKDNGLELSSASSDEIIVKNENVSTKDIEALLSNVPEKYKFFRVEEFIFEKIDENHDFFVKTTYSKNKNKIEFKNSPGHLFPQIYKRFLNEEPSNNDMLFYHDGYLCEFKDKVFPDFKKELNLKKLKNV